MSDRAYFHEIEIENDFRTYYANGYVDYSVTECIGGNYEGYAFELLYEREICDIFINKLWYEDEDTGEGVEILDQHKYRDIEKIAEEVIRCKFE